MHEMQFTPRVAIASKRVVLAMLSELGVMLLGAD